MKLMVISDVWCCLVCILFLVFVFETGLFSKIAKFNADLVHEEHAQLYKQVSNVVLFQTIDIDIGGHSNM